MPMVTIEDSALVEPVLADRVAFGVRPADQPVPPHLGQGPLAVAVARWLRMRDDPAHGRAKATMVEALDGIDASAIERHARQQSVLARPGGWDHWVWATSAASMAALLGVGPRNLEEQRVLVARLHSVARALAPTATAQQVASADRACVELTDALLGKGSFRLGLPERGDELPNRFALVWQSFDAGAALLGQALVALAQDPSLRRAGTIAAWLPSLMRERGAILSTRRFACADAVVDGHALRRGDGIVVGLRDHAFGHGPHACPGQRIALSIAATALETLLREADVVWPTEWKILTLPNAKVPFFAESPR